ncbi:MAG: radical SAM protein [archaeon]|nr:radical SAM protein [archaeon]
MLLNPPSNVAGNVPRDLLWGCWCKGKRIAGINFPPISLLQMDSILSVFGHTSLYLDAQAEKKSMIEVEKFVEQKQPDLVIIPTSTMTYNEDAANLKRLKDKYDGLKTLAFGSHATFEPFAALQREGVDFIAMKEHEYIVRDLVNAMEKGEDYSKIKGLGFKKDGKTIINEEYPFIENLDELPFPNRKLILEFEYFNPIVKRLPWTTAITSKGCPAQCNFCTSPTFYGNTWRARSAKNVADELEYLADLGYKEVFFRDETFTANRKRTVEICNEIKERKIEMEWICSSRVVTVDKQLMQMMKDAGCHMIRFGVESGDQQVLNNIKKGITVERTQKIFKEANEVGMETHAHVMIGNLGDTKETVEKTIKFVKSIKPTTATFGAFTPYAGTPIFEIVKAKHPEVGDGSESSLSTLHSTGYHSEDLCNLSSEQVGNYVRRAYKEFYLRPSYMLQTLRKINSTDELRRTIGAALQVTSYATTDSE